MLYFDGGPPEDYLDTLASLRPLTEKLDGMVASAAGITYEELEYEGVKGKAVVLVAGWESVEAHAAFKETAAYKENAAYQRPIFNPPEEITEANWMKHFTDEK